LDVHDHVLTAVHLSRITKSLDGQVNFTWQETNTDVQATIILTWVDPV